MMTKINDELQKHLDEAQKTGLPREVPVIVTIKANSDPAELAKKGLQIQHAFTSISAVSGTLSTAAVSDLAALAQVECIEYDGMMQAL